MTPTPNPADVDRNGQVNELDHRILVGALFGQQINGTFPDANRDGAVTAADLLALLR